MENLMPKKTANTPGKEYEIKRGYYSKLGIDRPSNRPSAFKFYPPIKKVIKEEEEIGKLRKSSSSELKTDAPLEEKEEEEKSTQNKNTTESQKIYEEGKIDDGKANKSSTAQNILGKSKRKIKARDRNRKLSMLDTPNQVPVESYETKESGNWRIDLLNTPIMARSGDRIRQDLLSKLTYK